MANLTSLSGSDKHHCLKRQGGLCWELADFYQHTGIQSLYLWQEKQTCDLHLILKSWSLCLLHTSEGVLLFLALLLCIHCLIVLDEFLFF